MGDTAGTKLREPTETRRLTAEYVNKTCILTCIKMKNKKKFKRMNGLFTYLGINTMNYDMFTQIQ